MESYNWLNIVNNDLLPDGISEVHNLRALSWEN